MTTFLDSLRRLRTAVDLREGGLPLLSVVILRQDLKRLLAEWDKVDRLVQSQFADLEGGGTKLIVNPAIREGFVCIADAAGKVLYFGPMSEMPAPVEGALPDRIIMNVNPKTADAIARATNQDS